VGTLENLGGRVYMLDVRRGVGVVSFSEQRIETGCA